MKNVNSCQTNAHEWRLNSLRERGTGVEVHLDSDNDRYFDWGYKAWFGCAKCYAKSERELSKDEYDALLPETNGFREFKPFNYPHDFVRPELVVEDAPADKPEQLTIEQEQEQA